MAAIKTADEIAQEDNGFLSSITGFLSDKWNNITGNIWEGIGNAVGPTLDSVGTFIDTKIKGLLDFVFSFVKSNIINMFGTGDFRNFMTDLCDNLHTGLVNAFVGAADAERLEAAEQPAAALTPVPAEGFGPR